MTSELTALVALKPFAGVLGFFFHISFLFNSVLNNVI